MKRIFIIFGILTVLAFGSDAATYKVEDIPNVHVNDSTKFITNPDGILTQSAQAEGDDLLSRLMRETTAELVAVVVDDIDPDKEIDDFATELFRAWGLGKKDTDNGGLLLIVKDRRQYVFRTGAGIEGLIPDGLAGSIMRQEMQPRFRDEDYDGGTIAALDKFATILSDPVAAEEIRSEYENNQESDDEVGAILFDIYFTICVFITIALGITLIRTAVKLRGKKRYDKYVAIDKLYPTTLFCSFACLGMPLLILLPLLLWRRQLRRGRHNCPDCGSPMKLVDEVHDNDYLTRAQDIEEQIGAVDYDVWVCPKDGETEIIPYISRSSAFTECPVCHAKTLRVVSDRTVRHPSTTSTGLRVVTKRCVNCGHEDDNTIILPKESIAPAIIAGAIVGSSGSGHSSGGFGGGSFGGGFTAGGGASGGW